MALFGYETNGITYYTCAGSIINKWYVLTAAHCLFDKSGRNPRIPTEIVLGDHVVGEDPDCNRFGCLPKVFKRQVKSYKIHENYQPGSVDSPYDLALIRLDRLVPVYEPENDTKSGVVPVCIPWRQNDPGRRLTTRADLLVTGWGRVTNNPRINSNNYRRFGTGLFSTEMQLFFRKNSKLLNDVQSRE